MALLYSIISERYVDDTIFTDNRYYFYHKFSYRCMYVMFTISSSVKCVR